MIWRGMLPCCKHSLEDEYTVVSSSTWVGRGVFKTKSQMGIKGPPKLLHHCPSELLIQDGMDPGFHADYIIFWPYHPTIFQSSTVYLHLSTYVNEPSCCHVIGSFYDLFALQTNWTGVPNKVDGEHNVPAASRLS